MRQNLRHLRAFRAVAETGSVTQAAQLCHLSQPAVTQALNRLEAQAEQPLFSRGPMGLALNAAGTVLFTRLRRAFGYLDPVLADGPARLRLTATSAQLRALIAVVDTGNFTLAAHRLGLAQPTVHRAVTMLEHAAGRALFERRPHGVMPSRFAQALARAAELTFAELDQAAADLADLIGREVGRIVVGAMPLSRAELVPKVIARFRQRRPNLPIRALDGPYDDLLAGLRRGEVDVLIGALRQPPPPGEVEQRWLFDDTLVMVARPGHPLAAAKTCTLTDLGAYPMVVAAKGSPARQAFDRIFAHTDAPPPGLTETGSMVLMRALLRITDHIGCISRIQIAPELELGTLIQLPVDLADTARPIGLTLRKGWLPTAAQADFLQALTDTVSEQDQASHRSIWA